MNKSRRFRHLPRYNAKNWHRYFTDACSVFRLLLFVLTQWQKKGFSHQLHTELEGVGEGIMLGDAVHLVHAILELLQRFLLLFCESLTELLSIPGNQLQEFLQPFIAASALLEGGYAVP